MAAIQDLGMGYTMPPLHGSKWYEAVPVEHDERGLIGSDAWQGRARHRADRLGVGVTPAQMVDAIMRETDALYDPSSHALAGHDEAVTGCEVSAYVVNRLECALALERLTLTQRTLYLACVVGEVYDAAADAWRAPYRHENGARRGMTSGEAALYFGISASAIRTHVERARAKLIESLLDV